MKKFAVIAVIQALVLVLLLSGALAQTSLPSPSSLLVLPFENRSKAPGLEWISESFPEVLSKRMHSSRMFVVSRDDRLYAFDRAGIPANLHLSRITLFRIAEQMDADYVVLGRYEYDGQTFTAHAQWLDMKHLHLKPEVEESGALANMVDVQYALAWDLLHQLQPDTLLPKLQFVHSAPPIRLDAFESYIRGVIATDRAERIRRFRDAIKLNPNYNEAMMELAKTYYDDKEYESAASWFARVPKTDDSAREANFYLGLSEYYLGDYAKAEDAFKFIANTLPLTEVYNDLGVVAGHRARRSELDYFQKAVQTDPNDPDYHYNYAIALYRAGDPTAAQRQLKETLNLKPGDADAKALLDAISPTPGNAFRPANSPVKLPTQRIKKNYDETPYLEIAMEIRKTAELRLANTDPQTHAKFYVDRGVEFLSQGFPTDAEASFREAILLDPANAKAHAGLASVLESKGELAAAAAEAKSSLQLQPSAEAYVTLARVQAKQNDSTGAGQSLDRALALDPSYAPASELKKTLVVHISDQK